MMTLRWALLLSLLCLCPGCTNTVSPDDKALNDEGQIGSILGQILQEKATLSTFRTAMEQLNSYYDHQGSDKTLPLPAGDEAVLRQLLAELKGDFDKAARIDEVKNRFFHKLGDASYIDACLLFRDAYAALRGDMGDAPSKQDTAATEAFQLALLKHINGWTRRQLALRSNPGNIIDWPANEMLRLGLGQPEDRLRVLISLLNQSEFDACAVIVKSQVRRDAVIENRQVPILTAVLVGKTVYVFDPFTGLPVPGPTPGSIATYDQVKKNPALLATRPEQPTATQLAESELVLMTPINALAPRMTILEKELDDLKVTVKLKEDVTGRIERFKAAGQTVKVWAAPNRNGYPGLVFQRYVESARGDPRLSEDILPRQKLIPAWALEAEKKYGLPGTQQSFITEFDRLFIRIRLEPGFGRDLLVRGKPHQAVSNLSKIENRIDRSLDLFHKDNSVMMLATFRHDYIDETLPDRYKRLMISREKMKSLPPDSIEARQEFQNNNKLEAEIQAMWMDQNIRTMLNNLATEWAVPELREHLTYFMGLAKMELAIRAELRLERNPKMTFPDGTPNPAQQYAAASEWFRRYESLVIPLKSNVWLEAVKLRHQECKEREEQLVKAGQLVR